MKAQIETLEQHRNSKVIVYAMADRPNLTMQIDEDVIEIFHEILETVGDQKSIDLFIYSRGGSTIVPLPLVRLIRKYCSKFAVLVPFRAHSAATMICVGADEIYMTRKAELGPVDPQLTLNMNQTQKIIATTDLFAYLEFAKNEMGWQASNTEISLQLLEFFHKHGDLSPDLIGKIYRLFTQSRKYIEELANSRSDGHELDNETVKQLANILVSGFGSHDYKIDSFEAKKLGLNVLAYDQNLESKINDLYSQVISHLKLNVPFIPTQPGREAAAIIMSAEKIATKYAIINRVGVNNLGQNTVDMGMSTWELA